MEAEFASKVFMLTCCFFCGVMLMSRGEVLKGARARGIVHRLGLLISVLGLYLLAMREALAALQPTLMDQELISIDQSLFGAVLKQAILMHMCLQASLNGLLSSITVISF